MDLYSEEKRGLLLRKMSKSHCKGHNIYKLFLVDSRYKSWLLCSSRPTKNIRSEKKDERECCTCAMNRIPSITEDATS